MSAPLQAADAGAPEIITLPEGNGAFSALMDALAPEAAPAAGEAVAPAAGDAAAGAAQPGTGAAALPTAGDAAAHPGVTGATAAGTDAGGGTGEPAAGADAGTGGRADLPETWTATAAEFAPKLGELSNAFEERVAGVYQQAAFAEVKGEHAPYFDALAKHPRLLVGQTVPAVGREGTETLRDERDVESWKDAVKSVLAEEIQARAEKAATDNKPFLDTVHQSIELFQKNADLIPGTKDFDVDLANRFAQLAKPYEVRVEEKLHGYAIPVQPLIDSIRAQLVTERATQTSAPAAATVAPVAAAAAPPATAPVDPPQAGIPSQAGTGASGGEDFSTLFGTLGLPNLRI